MNARSVQYTEIDLDPSELLQQTHAIANFFQMLKAFFQNMIHTGGLVTAPTTASTQLTGAGGVTEWRINVTAMLVAVGGVMADIAAAVDTVIHNTTNLLNAIGQSCYCDVVVRNVSGTLTVVTVKGVAAATASAAPPTDAVVQTAVGAGVPWVLIGRSLLTRSGDTAVTQTNSNIVRPVPSMTVDTLFGTFVG